MQEIRIPKAEIYDDPLHQMPILSWIAEQSDRIARFARIIDEIKEETVSRRVVAPYKLYECAAGFTEFYTKNIAYKSIYLEFKAHWDSKAEDIFNKMYLEIQREVTNPISDIGKKYKKKGATMAEIEREMTAHALYPEYKDYKGKADEFERKAKVQSGFLEGIGKLDMLLSMLQRAMTTELKFLHLE